MWSARTDEQQKEVEKIYRANLKGANGVKDPRQRAVVFRHFEEVTHPSAADDQERETEYRCTVPGCDHNRPPGEMMTRVTKR